MATAMSASDLAISTSVSLRGPRPDKTPRARQRRRLSAPPAPSQLGLGFGLRFRLHHSTDADTTTMTTVGTSSTARTVDALDLSSASPTQTLASLRWLVLTYLESLERSLRSMAGMGATTTTACPAPTLDDARQWARTALDMLSNIRTDVVSHFPTLNIQLPSSSSSGEMYGYGYGYSCSDVLAHVRAYLPAMELPQIPLPDWTQVPVPQQWVDAETVVDARTRFHDLDLEFHPKYIETLSSHLSSLREHLASVSVPFPFPPSPFSLYSSSFSTSADKDAESYSYSLPAFSFAGVAEALEALVMAVQTQLAEETSDEEKTNRLSQPTARRLSIVSRSAAEFMTGVRDGFEANVEAMREQNQEMMDTLGEQLGHMREGFDHMKEGLHENLTHMRDNLSHELGVISHELTAIRDELGHELDVLKDELEGLAGEIRSAVQRSLHGVHLIGYGDLPSDWKNNPFVTTGYRFIPIERWGLLVRSVFAFHNETLNIHTHLIPFLIWFSNLVFLNLSSTYLLSLSSSLKTTFLPCLHHIQHTLSSHIPSLLPPWLLSTFSHTTTGLSCTLSILSTSLSSLTSFFSALPTPPFPLAITPVIKARHAERLLSVQNGGGVGGGTEDPAELAFMSFALLCLFCSAVWHTMSGCADKKSMEFCARCDYIGIGWLISATVATIVYYGFQDCHPYVGYGFLSLCFCTGVMGNVFPFMEWFNMHKYRMYRVAFFLSMAFSGLAPMIVLGWLHSWGEMYEFIRVIIPSLLSYLIGLVFYATHVPERWLAPGARRKLDAIGGGSHAIWHCFIVLAVSQHKAAIQLLKMGVECRASVSG